KAGDGKLADSILQALAAVDITADSLITQLNSGEVAWRTQAADRLAMLGDPRGVPPLIEALTTAKDVSVRASAASALGQLKDRRAVDALVTATNSLERDVRLAAV